MRSGQVGTKIGKDLPEGERRLAEALCHLYGHLGVPRQEAAAELLAGLGYPRMHKSQLSRYLNGRELPHFFFCTTLFNAAAKAVWPADVGLSRGDLRKLYDAADRSQRRSCREGRCEMRRLGEAAPSPERPPVGLSASAAVSTASSEAAPHLPVPPPGKDRQAVGAAGEMKDRAAAHQVAAQVSARAEQLHQEGDKDALVSLLQESVQVMTPMESAAAVSLLRQRRRELADTLIRMAARERDGRHVMQAARELILLGQAEDAGALLDAVSG
ncbi:hypothetical protein [Streptomyces johnsoniae]|uniref:Uncharacterized protein n=1 Tax=Streptomyces johnsoniae TaxID=3075532 RepID=A0ABU2SHR8_9ACTN|nr:hypothetical protein [Streptomyces sp. DSM 41886]MDT0447300.1 hypothetical protein [Streptomyces sp. DSM 41886]